MTKYFCLKNQKLFYKWVNSVKKKWKKKKKYIYIYIYIYIYHHYHYVVPSARISLTLSRHLSLSLSATPHILIEQLYVGLSWLPCFCLAMWRGPHEYITFELIPTSPAVSCMSSSSDLDSFHDGWLVAV